MMRPAAIRETTRSNRAATNQSTGAAYPTAVRHWLIILFLVVFALPIEPTIGGQLVTGSRLYLMALFLPFVVALLARRGGAVTTCDVMIFGSGIWIALTFITHHGSERIPYAAIFCVEMIGAYLAGRLLVRNAADYKFFFAAFSVMLLILLPFAVFEMMTGRVLLSEMFSKFVSVTQRGVEIRNGFFRAGVSYPHQIHWGLVASLLLAQAWLLWRDHMFGRWTRAAVAVICTVTAMSSAPLLGLGIQTLLILWGRLTGNRWWLFVILFVGAYVTLDILSNRGPVIIMIETLALESRTAWWRVYIWEYGTISVMNHPFLGLGLNDWDRPAWLAPTVDNFWLLLAMRHGLPAIALLVLGLAVHVWRIIRAPNLSNVDQLVRTSYMIGFAALCFMLGTVHVWGSPFMLVMFYFGMGAFLYTGGAGSSPQNDRPDNPTVSNSRREYSPYSRFPMRPHRDVVEK